MIDLELLSDYQAWRDDNEGLDRDVTPIAYLAYRRALDNEDKLDRIMRLKVPEFLDADTYGVDAWVREAEAIFGQVVKIIGQETEHDRND